MQCSLFINSIWHDLISTSDTLTLRVGISKHYIPLALQQGVEGNK